jgi:hypothetical protein
MDCDLQLGFIAGIRFRMFYDKKQLIDSHELSEISDLFMDLSTKCLTLSTG